MVDCCCLFVLTNIRQRQQTRVVKDRIVVTVVVAVVADNVVVDVVVIVTVLMSCNGLTCLLNSFLQVPAFQLCYLLMLS